MEKRTEERSEGREKKDEWEAERGGRKTQKGKKEKNRGAQNPSSRFSGGGVGASSPRKYRKHAKMQIKLSASIRKSDQVSIF